MENKSFRDFIYVDEDILTMYFSQLPLEDRFKYEKQHSISELRWTLSLNPLLQRRRKKITVPEDQAISLTIFIEQYLINNNFGIAKFDTLDGQLILDTCIMGYMSINDNNGNNLFMGIPEEPIHEVINRKGRSFIVLGDISNCMNLRGYHDSASIGTSPLRRVTQVWQEINNNVIHDIQGQKFESNAYDHFSGGRKGVFRALGFLAGYAHEKSLFSELRGLYLHRDTFEEDGTEIHVLYPIFIERISLTSISH